MAERRLGRREAGVTVALAVYGQSFWLLYRLIQAGQWDAAVSLFVAVFVPSLGLIGALWSLKVFDPMSKRGNAE